MRNIKNRLIVSLFLALILAFASTQQTSEVKGEYKVISNSQYQHITVEFNPNYLSIRGKCGTQTGFFSNDKGSIKIGPFMSSTDDCKGSGNEATFVK